MADEDGVVLLEPLAGMGIMGMEQRGEGEGEGEGSDVVTGER